MGGTVVSCLSSVAPNTTFCGSDLPNQPVTADLIARNIESVTGDGYWVHYIHDARIILLTLL
jgi:hypothetical protein